MAFIGLGGFESGLSAELGLSSGGTVDFAYTGVVRTGTYSLRTNPTTTGIGYAEIGADSAAAAGVTTPTGGKIWYRIYCNIATLPASGSEDLISIRTNTGAIKCAYCVKSDGKIELYDQSNTLITTTTTKALITGKWYMIEIVARDGTNNAEFWVDGINWITQSIDFNATTFKRLNVGKVVDRSGQSVDYIWDDYSVQNSSRPGEGRCVFLVANGDGSTQEFTSGTGSSNYQEVDENPPDSTTYVMNPASANKTCLFTIPHPRTLGARGILNQYKIMVYLRENAAGSSSTLLREYDGTTTRDNPTAFDQGTTLGYRRYVRTTLPSGQAKTMDNLSTIEFGINESTSQQIRVSQVGVMLDYSLIHTNLSLLGCGA